jgi:predicted ABC-type transport system involved in lysophospholipase L1 biosynthesis ATPase subunit
MHPAVFEADAFLIAGTVERREHAFAELTGGFQDRVTVSRSALSNAPVATRSSNPATFNAWAMSVSGAR